MNYNELTKKQQSFVQHLFDMGHTDPNNVTFKRGELKKIAEQGGWAWAPAWIVKDKTRVVSRGVYNVPELKDLIDEMNESADVAAEGAAEDADVISDFRAQMRESLETNGMTTVTNARAAAGHPDPGGLAEMNAG